jgi:hypothetical protein
MWQVLLSDMVPHPAAGINRPALRVDAKWATGVAGYPKSVGISGFIANGGGGMERGGGKGENGRS